jgi:hypothetical protein
MKIIISIIVLIVMVVFTAIGYSSGRMLGFAGVSSADYTMHLASTNVAWSTALLILFGGTLFYFLKKRGKVLFVFLGFLFILWFLSGRTIGALVDPDGKIVVGWFYIETGEFYVCNRKTDCESVFYHRTKIESLPFWRIKINNVNIDKAIFVGPFIWTKTLNIFSDKSNIGVIK